MKNLILLLVLASSAPSHAHKNNSDWKCTPKNGFETCISGATAFTEYGFKALQKTCEGLADLLTEDEDRDAVYLYDRVLFQYDDLNCDDFISSGHIKPDGTKK